MLRKFSGARLAVPLDKAAFLLFIVLFLAAFLFPPVIASNEQPVRGDAFVSSSIAEPTQLIPLFASDSASAEVSHLIFNGLVKYDASLRLTGDLAESWTLEDGGKKLIFHLKKNVKWQDGAPFSTADVVFTFEKLRDPALPSPYGGLFEKVKNVTAKDDMTLEVIYSEPFSPGLGSWGMGILPKHLLEKENLAATSFSRKPIGTGPYKLEAWKTGQYLVLAANDHYFEGRPYIDKVVYRIIPDAATSFLELQTENLDGSNLTALQYARQMDTRFFKEKYKKYEWPGSTYTYLGYNLESPLFSDKNVRKAIGLAIPKKEIVKAALLGRGQVATGPYLPDSWAHNKDVLPTSYDPEASKKVLAEAGWVDTDADGILDKNGKKFSFSLLTNQGNDVRKLVCEIVQSRLRSVGIEAHIQMVESSVFLKEFIHKKRFEMVILAWSTGLDPDLYDVFHSSKTAPGQFNYVSYKNPEVDRLLEEGRRVFGEEKRAPIYKKIHQIIADDEPYTFLYVPHSLMALHTRFRGVEMTPLGLGLNFIKWFVPQMEQRYN